MGGPWVGQSGWLALKSSHFEVSSGEKGGSRGETRGQNVRVKHCLWWSLMQHELHVFGKADVKVAQASE